jgi:hypothetical protein
MYPPGPPRLVSRAGYENMVSCILQNLDQVVGAGTQNSGNGCWRVSTKVN